MLKREQHSARYAQCSDGSVWSNVGQGIGTGTLGLHVAKHLCRDRCARDTGTAIGAWQDDASWQDCAGDRGSW